MAKTRREKSRKRWCELAIAAEVFAIMMPFILLIRPVEVGLLAAAAAYLVISRTLRLALYRHHIRGARAMKRGDCERAIEAFEKSRAFFERHPQVDRFRCLTAFQTSRFTYLEMAHLNIAACLVRLERYPEARERYERILRASPENAVAAQMLGEMNKAGF